MGHRKIRVQPQGASERSANLDVTVGEFNRARFQEKLLWLIHERTYRKTDTGGLVSVY